MLSPIRLSRQLWGGEGHPFPVFPDGKREAVFDVQGLPSPVIRPLSPGDRIQPFGLSGHRKLQDVLVDAKVPRELRGQIWLVATPEGEVVWVPGILRSAIAPVGPGTREVWIFSDGARATCDGAPERSL